MSTPGERRGRHSRDWWQTNVSVRLRPPGGLPVSADHRSQLSKAAAEAQTTPHSPLRRRRMSTPGEAPGEGPWRVHLYMQVTRDIRRAAPANGYLPL